MKDVYTLSNGVRVLIAQGHTESVTVAAFVNTGARNETKKNNGISHFLEHMAFKGTTSRDYLQISSDVERLGADMNAFTSKDMTAYYVSGLAEHMDIFVNLIGDILLNSTLPEEEIERERNVILQEINRYLDNPNSIAYNLFEEAAFGDTAYGRSILGPKKNIKSFTRQDFVDYTATQYTAENVIVGIGGKVDVDLALKFAEAAFGGLRKGALSKADAPVYLGGIAVKRKAAFTQTQVLLGFPIASVQGDYYADMVAGQVIGGGMSSPLFNEIREKRGLVYSVGCSAYPGDQQGQMLISAGTTAENLEEFFKVTCQLLKEHTEKINPVDLERANNSIRVDTIRSLERPFRVIQSAVEDLFTFGEVKDHKDFLERIKAVTEDDVKNSIARMIQTSPTISMVGKGVQDHYLDRVKEHLK